MLFHLIVNEKNLLKKKNEGKLETVKSVFERAGKELQIHYTKSEGHAREIASEITEVGKLSRVIAMGGDGTIHEVFNGIKDPAVCHFGIIPMGTGNDFAIGAGIPIDTKQAAEIIAFKAPTYIDYIQLSNGLRSINAVGAGIDVDVLERTYAANKQGKNKYYQSLIESLLHYRSKNFTVEYNGKVEHHKGLIACLGNGKQIGGGIKTFPKAKIDDGYLDLLIVDYLSIFGTIKAFIKLSAGKLEGKGITQVLTKKVRFIPEGEDLTIQAEGELYKNVPFEAEIVSNKLKCYLPKND